MNDDLKKQTINYLDFLIKQKQMKKFIEPISVKKSKIQNIEKNHQLILDKIIVILGFAFQVKNEKISLQSIDLVEVFLLEFCQSW